MRTSVVLACALVTALCTVPTVASATPATTGTGNGFTAVTPAQVAQVSVQADSTQVVDLSASVPATATAVLLNVTATDVSVNTVVTAFPDGEARPATSNLNLVAGRTITTEVTVELFPGRKIDLYSSAGSAALTADLVGYYSPSGTAGLTSQTPSRVFDASLDGDSADTLDLSGSVPADATAVVLSLAGSNASEGTAVTAWPNGTSRPDSASLNPAPDQTVANTVTVPLGNSRKIDLYNRSGSVDLTADLAGYYAPSSTATFSTIIESRAFDNTLDAGTHTVDLSGLIPPTTTSVVLSLAVSGATAGTSLTAAAAGSPKPGVANLTVASGQATSSAVTVGVSTNGKIDLYDEGGSAVVTIDVFGYFAPPFTCTTGCVYGWGWNYLGTRRNVATPAPTPSLVFGLDHVVAIDNMSQFGVTYAVRDDGTLWAWGGNIYGNLGNGATCVNDTFPDRTTICYSDVPVRVIGLDHVTAVSGGMYSAYALRNDGTVWQIGPTATPSQVTGVSDVTALAGNGFTDYALESDSTVWAWGSNNQGLLGIGDTTVTYSQTPVQVHDLSGVTAISIAVGGEALRNDGTVWTWGPDGKVFNTGDVKAGDCSLPLPVAGLTGVTSLSGEHALKADGTVWSWGADNRGYLGNGTNSVSIQATPVQTQIAGAVTLAKHLDGAVLSDGTARTWGDNLFGELGNGRTGGEADSPVQVVGLTRVTALSGSQTSGYALTR